MQIKYTSLQTDNHTSTSPLSYYRPDALPDAQPTALKHCAQNANFQLSYCQVGSKSQTQALIAAEKWNCHAFK